MKAILWSYGFISIEHDKNFDSPDEQNPNHDCDVIKKYVSDAFHCSLIYYLYT